MDDPIEKAVFVDLRVPSGYRFMGKHYRNFDRIRVEWQSKLYSLMGMGRYGKTVRHIVIINYGTKRNIMSDKNFRDGCGPILKALELLKWVKDREEVKLQCFQKEIGHDNTKIPGTGIVVYKQGIFPDNVFEYPLFCIGCYRKLVQLCGSLDPRKRAELDDIVIEGVEKSEFPVGVPCNMCGSDVARFELNLHVKEIRYEEEAKTEST